MIGFILGLLAGFLLSIQVFLSIRILLFRMLYQERKSPFPFIDTCDALRLELENCNWKIVQMHDLQETLIKYGKQVNQIRIYEVFQPDYTYEIMAKECEYTIASFIPCRIVVYEKTNRKTFVSVVNGKLMTPFAPKRIRRIMAKATMEIQNCIRKALGD